MIAVVLPGEATDVSLFQFHAIPTNMMRRAEVRISKSEIAREKFTLQCSQLDRISS